MAGVLLLRFFVCVFNDSFETDYGCSKSILPDGERISDANEGLFEKGSAMNQSTFQKERPEDFSGLPV